MEEQLSNEKSKMKLSIPASILIAGVMISLAIYFTGTEGTPKTATPKPNPTEPILQEVDIKNVEVREDPFIGVSNAPITMAYWSDYQCPFCKKTETEVLPILKRDYVDTGKMKIVFKDFVFLGPDSIEAALFDRAVWELYPAQYFTWREAMYAAQDGEGGEGFGDRASIEALTQGISGIDQSKVSAAVDANKDAYQASIQADYVEGQSFGINGTPSVIIGTTLINGAQPLAAFIDAIEKVEK